MRLKFLAAPLMALSLAACATSSSHLDQGKAIDTGWLTLNAAAQTADQLAVSGKLKGAQAARIKADLDQATAIMNAAQAAYQANTGTDVSAQIAEAAALVSEVITITSGVPK